jgi:hypothetical protein
MEVMGYMHPIFMANKFLNFFFIFHFISSLSFSSFVQMFM